MATLSPSTLSAFAAILLLFVSSQASSTAEQDTGLAPDDSNELVTQDTTDSAASSALEKLRGATQEQFIPALEFAFAEFRRHALALEFERAIPLGEGMHAEILRRGEPYFLTSGWSATQLGLVYTRSGDHAAAEILLAERVQEFEVRLANLRAQSAPDRAAMDNINRGLVGLLNRRSMARLAAGDEAGGVADLGAGLARGSTNARLILGRRALQKAYRSDEGSVNDESGANSEARRLFSTLLEEEPSVAAWALRGWGLTLLPPSRTQ